MHAFKEFIHKDASFWAFIEFISESLGYTERHTGTVKFYSISEIEHICLENNMPLDNQMIYDAAMYSKMRADLLNHDVASSLMNVDAAKEEFSNLLSVYEQEKLRCSLPMNKQKGDKRQIAYFTAIIHILTELTIRRITGNCSSKGFNDNPQKLSFVWNQDRQIIGASSRRFDGAFPDIHSPKIIWEIKEYYYTTTFGSRIADGVYETKLDGYELKDLYNRTGYKVFHVLFIDAYDTWWKKGKSYLCRIIDTLNCGLLDEVIVGREVINRWPQLLSELL